MVLVEESGDSAEDREARALLNKFLGASVLMTGVESMMPALKNGSTGSQIVTTITSSKPATQKVRGVKTRTL